MFGQRPITTMKVFNGEILAASGTKTSVAIDLRQIAQNYQFSLEYIITGTGTTKIEYLTCSTKDGTYTDGAVDIGATLASGTSMLAFEPLLAPFMKIKITEDGGANGVVATINLNIQ